MKKALVAMSGGVDSTAALLIMRRAGYEADGVMMRLLLDAKESEQDAQNAAKKLGAKLFILDLAEEFKRMVVDEFAQEYINCRTPNPCVLCNMRLKFGVLADYAKENGYDCFVTGHYARVEKDGDGYFLKKAADLKKDQSYMLYGLRRELLSFLRFPLGELTKEEARKELMEQGFNNAAKKDSQDICFVPDGDYAGFIKNYTGRTFEPGDFCDREGNVLGKHKGMIHYTIGQRKGLGLALPEPMYVIELDKEHNRVVLSANEGLFQKTLIADRVNLLACDKIDDGTKLLAKARYSMKEQPARVYNLDNGKVLVEFEQPQRAITPGQSVVFYDGEIVVGGGQII